MAALKRTAKVHKWTYQFIIGVYGEGIVAPIGKRPLYRMMPARLELGPSGF
jgi:hypothetical protein